MSYPIHQVPGGSAARTTRTDHGFWGLELSQGALARDFSRAMDTENLIWAGDALKKRPGYRLLESLEGQIHGIFAYKSYLMVHAGRNLYRLLEGAEPELIYTEMWDGPSQGVVANQSYTRRSLVNPALCHWKREQEEGDFLFLINGNNFLFTNGERVRPMADPFWGTGAALLYEAGAYDLAYCAEVPFAVVAKDPYTNVGDGDPRGDNRLSQFRCESFCLGETAVDLFQLSCKVRDLNYDTPPEVQLRDSNGYWHCLCTGDVRFSERSSHPMGRLRTCSLQAGMIFHADGGIITAAGTGEYTLANDGMDNLRITYAVEKERPLNLIQATAMGLFGADGADNVLFLGGGSKAPGEDYFSVRDNFFCFYETSVERLGNRAAPITGYCRLSDGRLAVLKNEPNGSAVYFRDHTLVTLGTTQAGEPYRVDAFPSRAGAAVEGCINPHSVGFAGNEPCFLGRSGLYSVRSVSDELTNLNETVKRSRSVDPWLREQEPALARGIRWKEYYLLCFGHGALITDGARDSSGALRFLRWRFGHSVTALGQLDGLLYLGDGAGNLYLFGEESTDAGLEFTGYWHTPLLEEQAGRRMILRQMWAAVSPAYEGALSAAFFRDRLPLPERQISLQLLDFADWDFGNVSFEGTDTARWVRLSGRAERGDGFSLRVELSPEVLLWGFRWIYEKGGRMR